MPGSKRDAGYAHAGIRLAVLTAGVTAAANAAVGADFSIIYKNDTDYRLTDNILDTANNLTPGLEISTTHSLDLLAKTKTDIWRLSPRLNSTVSLYDDSGFEPDHFPGITASYSHQNKLWSFGADAFFNYAEATASDTFRNVLLVEEDGTQLTYGGNLSASLRTSKRDSLSWNASYSVLEYEDILTLEPSESFGTTFGWTHQWTALTSTNMTLGFNYVIPEPYISARNPEGRLNPIILDPSDPRFGLPQLLPVAVSERLEFTPAINLDTRLTKRLAASGSIGMSVIDQEDQEASASFIYSLKATYTLNETSFNIGFGRQFGVADGGGTEGTYNFDAGATHQVNDLTTLGAFANVTYSPQPGSDTTGVTVTPYVSYKFARDWDSRLSYEFSYTDEDAEEIFTNSLILKVSYLKTLLK
jgi:hypothetical protein